MELSHAVVLALVQGLTEFLPISSSAHLVLVPAFLGWPDQGLAFDVCVHLGTLAAVVAYFHRELARMAWDWLRSLRLRREVGDSRLAWGVLLGTVPVGALGLALDLLGEDVLRSPRVIGLATVGFALLLWWADRRGTGSRDEHALGWRGVLVIGCSQALALIPGTSRSGITITAGLALGLSRAAAARFSFLLSVPVIVLAGGLKAVEAAGGAAPVDWAALLVGALLSGLSAYLCIHGFLRLLERVGMLPFIVYRLLLGAVILVFVV